MRFVSSFLDSLSTTSTNLDGCFLHIHDLFTKEQIDQLIQHNSRPAVILSDHMTITSIIPSDITGIFLPLFAANMADLCGHNTAVAQNTPETAATLCFIANKKTLTRSLCMRMIEIFGFRDYLYTWSGEGRHTDMTPIIQELNALRTVLPIDATCRLELLKPIRMQANFMGDQRHRAVIEHTGTDNARSRWWAALAWKQELNDIFWKSAVAVITESDSGYRETVITEKTVYSVLGCNFPIWFGGYQQARYWKEIGFDIFEDVVDHSYQEYSSLIERCWYAFDLNRRLLSDLDYAKSLRETHWNRLIANRDLLTTGRLRNYCQELIDHMPLKYQHHARSCLSLITTSCAV